MERTESIVVSVAPDRENEKISEMQHFGWSLQGRQEVVGHLREAEAPDTLGAAMFRGALEGATGRNTYEYDHYVKLHFVRDLHLAHGAEIRTLEREYFSLPMPSFPRLFPGGVFLVLLWYPFWPFWYFFGYRQKKAAAEAHLRAVQQRADEIATEVEGYLQRPQ
ncbi:MAG TPA: hypothetical protein VF017_18410 [Thermoanaerobaculia bacterium]|nr:hypothetical protein [Thermoanaerobaculia bacterium]